jgi:hypothetical protein
VSSSWNKVWRGSKNRTLCLFGKINSGKTDCMGKRLSAYLKAVRLPLLVKCVCCTGIYCVLSVFCITTVKVTSVKKNKIAFLKLLNVYCLRVIKHSCVTSQPVCLRQCVQTVYKSPQQKSYPSLCASCNMLSKLFPPGFTGKNPKCISGYSVKICLYSRSVKTKC